MIARTNCVIYKYSPVIIYSIIYYYILAVYYYASFFRLRILRKEEVHSGYRIWYLEIVFQISVTNC